MLVEVKRNYVDKLKTELAAALTDLAEARAQITAYMNELAKVYAENEALAARHEKALVEGAARLAERDEARAQIAAMEQEHQDFRLQNDAEWRAKLDHLKAQIAAKDVEIERLKDDAVTDGMIEAGYEAHLAFGSSVADIYRAMRAAKPARETDPYEAERKQRVTRGIAEIEAMRARKKGD